jgi:hypothetical protein
VEVLWGSGKWLEVWGSVSDGRVVGNGSDAGTMNVRERESLSSAHRVHQREDAADRRAAPQRVQQPQHARRRVAQQQRAEGVDHQAQPAGDYPLLLLLLLMRLPGPCIVQYPLQAVGQPGRLCRIAAAARGVCRAASGGGGGAVVVKPAARVRVEVCYCRGPRAQQLGRRPLDGDAVQRAPLAAAGGDGGRQVAGALPCCGLGNGSEGVGEERRGARRAGSSSAPGVCRRKTHAAPACHAAPRFVARIDAQRTCSSTALPPSTERSSVTRTRAAGASATGLPSLSSRTVASILQYCFCS